LRIAHLITALFAVAIAAASPAIAQDSDAVVATVNGVEITEKDLDLARGEIGDQLSRIPEAERRRVLVEFLIENHLVAAAAKSGGVGQSADFKQRMDYWERRSLRDSYFESEIRNSVTNADLKAFYDKEISGSGDGEEEIRASHILVKTKDKAIEIFEALAHDGDFGELAQKHSLDPGSKRTGGDLNYFTRGRMVPEFEQAAFKLKVGVISDPVQSKFGWHIIKVTDRRTQQAPPFDAVKERIRVVLIRQKVRELVDGYREKADIKYVDPGVKARVEASKASGQSR